MFPNNGLWLQRVSQVSITLISQRSQGLLPKPVQNPLSTPSPLAQQEESPQFTAWDLLGGWHKRCIAPSDQTLLFRFIPRLFLVFLLEEN